MLTQVKLIFAVRAWEWGYLRQATVKAGMQECGTEHRTEVKMQSAPEINAKCSTMNVHAHIVKAHMVIGDHQVYSLAV